MSEINNISKTKKAKWPGTYIQIHPATLRLLEQRVFGDYLSGGSPKYVASYIREEFINPFVEMNALHGEMPTYKELLDYLLENRKDIVDEILALKKPVE